MKLFFVQVVLIAGVLLYFALLFYLLRKRTLSIKFSILWLAMGVIMIIFAAIPQLLVAIASLLGFEVASNALFSILFLLILLILLSLSSSVSKYQMQIKTLAQKIAIVEKELHDKYL
ncbi:MAG: DUF2304 domain-containing protein [Clostridiales bacterium]|nr:DUF2304 domain-containing protein [Clostridiales bacterium]